MIVEKKADIIAHLNRINHEITELAEVTESAVLYKSFEGKWSAAQNIDHLIKSAKPLVLAFRLPRVVLGLFGKKKSALSYDGVVAQYQEVLKKGGKSPVIFEPPRLSPAKKDKLIEEFSDTYKKLVELLSFFSEDDLDKISLPHPLLGKLSMREMLFFTVYHMRHHSKTIKELTKI